MAGSDLSEVLLPAIAAEIRRQLAAEAPMPSALQTLERAKRAVRRIDQQGIRGITLVTMEEIEAMAMMLVVLGLEPYAPAGGVTETTKGDTP